MKIFVSGQIEDIENVRKIQKAFVDAGHEITHDWTTNEGGTKMLGSREDKLNNVEESARRTQKDIAGVVESEVYVICTNNKSVGKGMYVELGAALALNAKVGKPKLYILGEMNHMSIFYLHPALQSVGSVDEILSQFNLDKK